MIGLLRTQSIANMRLLGVAVMLCSLIWAFISVLVLPTPASARAVESWPYERLFKEADLIVIAEPVSTKTTDKTYSDNRWKADFPILHTTVTIASVLKGQPPKGELTVFH